MNSKKILLISFLGLFLMIYAIDVANAATVGNSEVGVEDGQTLTWGISGMNSTGTVIIHIDNVTGTGDDLVVNGDVIEKVGGVTTFEVYNIFILKWNAITEVVDFGIQATGWVQTIWIAPKLNLNIVATNLTQGSVSASIDGNVVTATDSVSGDIFVSTYNNNGILQTCVATINMGNEITTVVISLKKNENSVSLGYILFLIIPIAIVALIIRERKIDNYD